VTRPRRASDVSARLVDDRRPSTSAASTACVRRTGTCTPSGVRRPSARRRAQHAEQAQLDQRELGDRHLHVELVRAPLHVARPQELRIRDPPEADAARDHAVEDRQAHVVAGLEAGRPAPAPERPDRDDEPAPHLLVQRGREATPEVLVEVEQRRQPTVAEGCGDRPRERLVDGL
jgi:hypothetical protein